MLKDYDWVSFGSLSDPKGFTCWQCLHYDETGMYSKFEGKSLCVGCYTDLMEACKEDVAQDSK